MSPVLPPHEMVLASAGSGKTFHISSRLIGLLAYGEDPDRVLAATFTRKAAGEILDRVLTRLAIAAREHTAARELAEHARFAGAPAHPPFPAFWAGILERVVRDLHRFDVGTLDAFFIRAAGSYGADLGLPPGWRIPDAPSVERLRSEALLRVLASIHRPELVELVRLASRGEARRSVHDRIEGMMEYLVQVEEQIDPAVPDPWLAFAPGPIGGAAEDPEELAQAVEAIVPPRKPDGRVRGPWDRSLRDAAAALRAGDWEGLAKVTLCQKVAADEPEFDRAPITPEVRAVVRRVLDAARAALRPRLGRQVAALGRLTREFEAHYRDLQRSTGLFSFGDVTRLIAGAGSLAATEELYYRLDARTRHVLLDEFQDTSLPQWEVLAPLVQEVVSDDGRAAVIVADPKQSIYGWRGAEPAIVETLEEEYGLPQRSLARSYRSSRVVLDFVNTVFGSIAGNPALDRDDVCRETAEEWARHFDPHDTALDLPGYVCLEAGPADEGRGRARPRLARYTAEKVAALSTGSPGFSIGVLTRTNAAVSRLFLELRRLGLDVSQEGGTPLTDSPACEAVLALLRLADHPLDTIARYHVARTPLGEAVQLTDPRDRIAAERAARRVRRELVADGYGVAVGRWVDRLVRSGDARDGRRLFQLVELAHRYDAGGTLRPGDFARLVETERVEDRTTAGIRVMTIHQAKGLEFDIVVLPQLDDSIFSGGRPAPTSVYRARPGGRITAVLPPAGRELRCLFPELEAAERQRKRAVVRDALSTLYVAITRPRYALHAVLCPDGDGGPGKGASPARILRNAAAGNAQHIPHAPPGRSVFESGDPEWSRDPRARPEYAAHPERIEAPAPRPALRVAAEARPMRRRTPSDLHDEPVLVREVLRIENADALDRGSVVHAWFERVRWVEEPAPGDDELIAIARDVGPDLAPDRVRTMLAEFREWLADPAVRGVLSRDRYPAAGRIVVERELPFLRRTSDGWMEGVIDRLVLVHDPDGAVVGAEIIDFKTDRVPEGEDRLAAFAARYRAQLAAYADAVAELYAAPRAACRATLLLLEQRRPVEVDLARPIVRAEPGGQLTLDGLLGAPAGAG